jgi:hypothetical protein
MGSSAFDGTNLEKFENNCLESVNFDNFHYCSEMKNCLE